MGMLHCLRRARTGGWLLFAVVALLALAQSASGEKLQDVENEVWNAPLSTHQPQVAQATVTYTNLLPSPPFPSAMITYTP